MIEMIVIMDTGVPRHRGLGILPGRLVIQNIAQKVCQVVYCQMLSKVVLNWQMLSKMLYNVI